MSIALVTDSTSDIPIELAQKFNIHIVPNIMVIDGQSLKDGEGISRQEFYERLPEMKTLPTTGTASPGVYEQLYGRLFDQGADHILSIHASARLSGIINAASTAAQMFDDRVRVIDSLSVTLGLGFQVLAAAERLMSGDTLEALLTYLDDIRPRARVVAMLDTLEYVRRSGRVSWARARLGNLLSIKPFIEVKNGLVHSLGEARTRRKGIDRLKHFLFNQGPLERLAMLHTNAEGEAREFLSSVNLHLASAPLVVNVTTVVGTHAGPNALGFAVVAK